MMNIVNKIILLCYLTSLVSCKLENPFSSLISYISVKGEKELVEDKSFDEKDTERYLVDGFQEPPEPDGKINNESLSGIDTNENGVRDDLERMINRKYMGKDQSNSTLRKAFKQLIVAKQSILLFDSKLDSVEKIKSRLNRNETCLIYLFCYKEKITNKECSDKLFETIRKIDSKLLNTDSRRHKWKENEIFFTSNFVVLSNIQKKQESCDFLKKE